MTLQELVQLYAMAPALETFRKTIEDTSVRSIFLEGLVASSTPVVFSTIAQRQTTHPQLFVLPDEEEAGYFYHDLRQILGHKHQSEDADDLEKERVMFFPSSFRRAIKYAQRDAANEILRTEVLTQLSNSNSPLTIVTYPSAIAEQVISQQQLNEKTLVLQQGQSVEVDNVTKILRDFGFREVDYVYEPGQFALRGSILDVFSFSSEYPFRIDFFGDDIDTIRTFEVEDQLSRDHRSQVNIVPEMTNSQSVAGSSFVSFLKKDTILVAKDFAFVSDMIDRTSQEANLEEVQVMDGKQFTTEIAPFRKVEFGHHPSDRPDVTLTFHTSTQPLLHKNFELLKESFFDYQYKGYRIYVLADSTKQLQRLQDILQTETEQKLNVGYVEKTIHAGFIDHDQRFCIFTDHEIFDRFHKYSLRSDRARSGKAALTLKEIQQFEIGDYVVHVDHGIGKFGGLVRMPIANSPTTTSGRQHYQEMIKIIYQGGGSIYVSIHSLYKVSKYKAQDNGEPPRLSQLGTGQWERLKERTKSKLKDIARDLIKLYAARKREKGFAFSADSFMQHELEASFLYEDTPDQLKVTNDVKADMEKARPMDRLVCGDVGFGKTEVAVRAAFKAACDSKQVAVLVPTTVLAYQHYQTFKSRLKDFPVRVEYLSRARSAKQTKQILQDLEEGKIDILIGTHKLIGKTVKFKDLGLLIIDEEQKFGVSTKEKLRQMKTNVDTLTLTATPIPRTLQFSLLGARDLSIIQTPPPNRYPIQTEIHTLNPEIIAEAVNFEMSRNGQVYFVNPRINDLQRIATMIHTHVPDARIAIGHGQMKPEELEKIIFDFVNFDYDILLSTTIIENGIDIPNANTIIINGAHHFGLSDLHQMRGRVGRGTRKAYCYLLAPPLADLPQESRRRLEALETFSELGSGIQIAMQDLDIRGAGNLLGAEQSGFIADLGYETYQKILNQAMQELRAEEPAWESQQSTANSQQPMSLIDTVVDTDLALYFPDQYIPSDSERMLLYRELDNLHTDDQLAAYRTRLVDRFGTIPQEGEELMCVVPLRRLAGQLGCEKLMLKQGRMTIFFVSNSDNPFYQSSAFDAILQFVGNHPRRCQFRDTNGKRSLLISNIPTVESALQLLKSIITPLK